jgi:amino acid transporter
MPAPNREGLIRAVRKWDVVALTVNGVIGAGIFGLPSEAFARLGLYSLVGFVVCGAAVALITLCFAEVASRFSETGGPYLYGREAFGPLVGFQVGWTTWIARLTAFAANSNLLVSYLGFFFPAAQNGLGRAAVITAIVLFYTVLNVVGVRDTTRVGNVLTFAKLAPLVLFVVAGAFFVRPAAFMPAAAPSYGEFSSAMVLLLYAFVGFEMAAIPAGEMRDPQRDQPPGLLIGMAFIVALYLAVQVVAIGTSPDLANSQRPLADAASAFLGSAGGGLIAIGAMVSVFGNLGVVMMVSPRLLFAMAERRELPRFMGTVHPNFRTPHFAIYVTSAAMLALALSGTFVYAATISVVSRLFTYAVTCAAVPVLRRKLHATPARFRVPAGTLVAGLALLLLTWLALNTTARQARDVGIAFLIGFALYALSRRK